MLVREIMSTTIGFIETDASLVKAAEAMTTLDVGFLPVTDNGKLAGVLTDRDIVTRAVREGRDPNATLVQDVMTHDATSISEQSPVAEAADVMKRKKIRRVLVHDADKNLVGIVSLGDIATENEDQQLVGETLEKVSQS